MADMPAAVPAQPPQPSLLAQVLGKISSDSVRRAAAAVAGVALPFLVGVAEKYDVHVDPTQVLAAEGVLAAYITQSVINSIHARSVDAGSDQVLK